MPIKNPEYGSIEIESVYTQIINLSYTGAPGLTPFDVHCPFVPDRIEVQMAIGARQGQILPNDIDDGQGADSMMYHSNLYAIKVSMFPEQPLTAVCNGSNTFNPKSVFQNLSRLPFSGTYEIKAYNLNQDNVEQQQLTDGYIIVTFKFIRFH